MRVSVLKDDPGYKPDAYAYRVFLNGVEHKNCITADEERGECVVYVLDNTGRPKFDACTKKTVTEIVKGAVVIARESMNEQNKGVI